MSSITYLLKRTAQTVFLLFVVLTFLFFLLRLMPGSITSVLLADGASEEAIAAFERKWGLNQPLYVQYYQYLKNFLTLDMGNSLQNGEPVWEYTKDRILNTLLLGVPAITLAYVLGTLFGSYMGFDKGSKIERTGLVSVLFVGSFPSFFLAMVMVIVFAGILGIFPTGGLASVETLTTDMAWYEVYLTKDFLWHWTLPAATVVLRYLFLPTTTMRTSLTEVSNQEFMFYHEVSGLPSTDQLRRLIRHSILPVITLYPISIAQSMSGLVLIETVFNWPGIGYTIVQAVFARDFPVLMFLFFITAALVIISNFIVDILYMYIDPRISLEEEA
ncbi:ABC transporter permease [Halobellus salinisoli]|uniref:ABC transporter permease n=1 Tax=Halobellus salinisoli TaxID=3108500 RepID=UPI0030084888